MVAWFYGSRRAMVQIIFKVIDNTMISLSYPTPDLLDANEQFHSNCANYFFGQVSPIFGNCQ